MNHWFERGLAVAALASGVMIATAGMASAGTGPTTRRPSSDPHRDQGGSRRRERHEPVDRSVATPLQLTVGGCQRGGDRRR
jgi:hypothetical protein